MRTLDLNAYGVCEMNDVEMRDVDGGGAIAFALAFSLVMIGAAIASRGNGISF
ncbi:MAG: hypothetical protein LBL94_10290 [Prevotellaceae bacterium]|jgi:hypothetical protein|nr:hypothetical protein [Prevotellaceae bacterium]